MLILIIFVSLTLLQLIQRIKCCLNFEGLLKAFIIIFELTFINWTKKQPYVSFREQLQVIFKEEIKLQLRFIFEKFKQLFLIHFL